MSESGTASTSQMYVFPGINLSKTREDARKYSAEGQKIIVHMHRAQRNSPTREPVKCGEYKHERYEDGKMIDEWGSVDGSGGNPVLPR